MSLTTIVGALLAVVARPKQEQREVEHLRRSHARLIDHIERLERELALTQELLAHWRNEAARLARENRERREQSSQTLYAQYHSALQQELIGQQQFSRQQGLLQAQNQQLAACAPQMQTFEGFCNCVPSRSQVWGASHGLVQQLNDNGRT